MWWGIENYQITPKQTLILQKKKKKKSKTPSNPTLEFFKSKCNFITSLFKKI
jgi:hypothetical protein